jgi:hypothetical protein
MIELSKERALRRFRQVLHELVWSPQGDVSDADALRAFRHMARDALDLHPTVDEAACGSLEQRATAAIEQTAAHTDTLNVRVEPGKPE